MPAIYGLKSWNRTKGESANGLREGTDLANVLLADEINRLTENSSRVAGSDARSIRSRPAERDTTAGALFRSGDAKSN